MLCPTNVKAGETLNSHIVLFVVLIIIKLILLFCFVGRTYTHWDNSSRRLVLEEFNEYLTGTASKKLPGKCEQTTCSFH